MKHPATLTAILTAVLFIGAVSAAETIMLNAAEAKRKGAIQNKWGKWVVWCGHNLCEGTYSWQFPSSGKYALVWNVGHKCAGSPQYKLSINNKVTVADRIPQHGSCDGCTPMNIVNNPGQKYGRMKDINLGNYTFRKGDRIDLSVKNDFACGMHNPGAYGFTDGMRAVPR